MKRSTSKILGKFLVTFGALSVMFIFIALNNRIVGCESASSEFFSIRTHFLSCSTSILWSIVLCIQFVTELFTSSMIPLMSAPFPQQFRYNFSRQTASFELQFIHYTFLHSHVVNHVCHTLTLFLDAFMWYIILISMTKNPMFVVILYFLAICQSYIITKNAAYVLLVSVYQLLFALTSILYFYSSYFDDQLAHFCSFVLVVDGGLRAIGHSLEHTPNSVMSFVHKFAEEVIAGYCCCWRVSFVGNDEVQEIAEHMENNEKQASIVCDLDVETGTEVTIEAPNALHIFATDARNNGMMSNAAVINPQFTTSSELVACVKPRRVYPLELFACCLHDVEFIISAIVIVPWVFFIGFLYEICASFPLRLTNYVLYDILLRVCRLQFHHELITVQEAKTIADDANYDSVKIVDILLNNGNKALKTRNRTLKNSDSNSVVL